MKKEIVFPWITILISVIGGVVWTVTTFATIEYVDKKHFEIREDIREIRAIVLKIYEEVKRK